MLILTRKPGERIMLDDDIVIKVLDIDGHIVRLGIDAPDSVAIHREEIYIKVQQEKDDG